MEYNQMIVVFFAGLFLGAVFCWALLKWSGRLSSSQNAQLLHQENENLTKDNFKLDQQNQLLAQRLMDAEKQLSSMETKLFYADEKLINQKTDIEELQNQFQLKFENLANKILEEKSQKFTQQNQENLGTLLRPLKEQIQLFERKMEESGKQSLEWNIRLKEQLLQLKEANLQITKEAENLTLALKGDKKAQGNWGEMQLDAILEKAGLEKDIHFWKEKNFQSKEGLNQRPDFIIKLPDQKHLILDSKVSINAYMEFINQSDKEVRDAALKQHLLNLHTHIKQLSERNYQTLYQIDQPDYVLMFVANEPALTTALRQDGQLFEKALEKNIILVSSSTLMATLRTIAFIWKQEMQSKNAALIAKQAASLYDKFVNFTEDMNTLGNQLQSAQKHFDLAMNKLSTGKGNLIQKALKMKELGTKPQKDFDNKLLKND